MDILPPLGLLERWRVEEGLSPEQVYERARKWLGAVEGKRAPQTDECTESRPWHTVLEKRNLERRAEIEEIKRLREAGLFWKEIGAELGRSAEYCRAWATRGEQLPPEDTQGKAEVFNPDELALIEKIKTLKEQVKSWKEISQELGASVAYCYNLARRAGIPTGKTQAMKERVSRQAQTQRRLLPDNQELVRLYQDHTMAEIAGMFGVSQQAVGEKLRRLGAAPKKRNEIDRACTRQILALKEKGLNKGQVCQELGISAALYDRLARQAGIDTGYTPKPIGCPVCDLKPYVKGLCKNCYARSKRKNLSPEDKDRIRERAAQANKRPGRPAKAPKETNKPKRDRGEALLKKVMAIKALRQQGKTLKQIRAELGISESYASVLLKKYASLDKP